VAQALSAIENMVRATDFDKRMLFLATQLAHEYKMRNLLLTVLKSLFETLQSDVTGTRETRFEAQTIENITIIRCIIRLVLEMLKEPLANISSLIDVVLVYFSRGIVAKLTLIKSNFGIAIQVASEAKQKGHISVIRKDISWLWRSGYNAAIGGCSEWEGAELGISNLFELVEKLIVLSNEGVTESEAQEISIYRIFSSFSSIAGKGKSSPNV